MMSKEELIEKINAVLAEEFEVDESAITPEGNVMQTLELDSLDLVDMVVLIEKHFGFKLTADDFKHMATFQSFYDFIYDKIQSN